MKCQAKIYQVKLKQLITHALTLTSDSLAISSITPTHVAGHHRSQKVLSMAALETLFAMAPADLPNQSAAAMRLAVGEREEDEIPEILKENKVRDYKWQLMALLAERSTVKEALMAAKG